MPSRLTDADQADDRRTPAPTRRPIERPTCSASATTTTTAWLRKTAEFDNYRKRIERERREQADQAVVDLLLELLLVVDDFDRALTVDAGDERGAYRKGVELIHAKLHDLLRKRGVQADRGARRRFRSRTCIRP